MPAIADIDYSLLPERLRGGMKRYVEHGIEPGSFLVAALENKLVESFACADETSSANMFRVANFLYNEMPRQAWGSREAVKQWLATHRESE